MTNSSKRKIAIFTGSRAEYGILKPIISILSANGSVELLLIAAGSHLEGSLGKTEQVISEDGYKISLRVKTVQSRDDRLHLAYSTSKAIPEIAEFLAKSNPECLILLGDRSEAFAAATAAMLVGVPIVHLHGGEVAGAGLDEYFRHSISKMAALHFTATEKARKRLILMGEQPEVVFNMGSLGFETAKRIAAQQDSQVILEKHGLGSIGKFAVVIMHSISTDPGSADLELRTVVNAVASSGLSIVLISPNSDPGHAKILEEISRLLESKSIKLKYIVNLKQEDYFAVLGSAEVLVGNSSSGILESGALKLPFVNVLPRQKAREKGANVIDAECDAEDIGKQIMIATSPEFRKRFASMSNPYDGKDTSQKICKTILGIDFRILPSPKVFYDAKEPLQR